MTYSLHLRTTALFLLLVLLAPLLATRATAQTTVDADSLKAANPALYQKLWAKANGPRPTPLPTWSKGSGPLTPFAGASPDCASAAPICAVNFPTNTSFNGFGNTQELNSNTCLLDNETNSNWFIFTTQTAGALTFLINPGTGVDFDFALYNITGVGCSAIPTLTPVRCNYSGYTGNTGLVLPVSASPSLSGGAFSLPTMPGINVAAGQTFALLVDNFDGLQNHSFSLSFGSGTGNAIVADIQAPTLAPTNGLVVNCANPFGQLTLTFNEAVDCATLQANDFAITGPAAVTITGFSAPACVSGTFTNTVTLNYTVASQTGGTYTLAHVGNVADVCGNVMGALNQTFTLPTRPSISASATSVCAGGTVTLTATGGAPGATYTWSNGATGASITPTVNATTNFTVTANQPGVCSITSTPVTITPLNAPVVTFSPATPAVCTGQTVAVTASVTVGGAPCNNCVITFPGQGVSGPGPSLTVNLPQGNASVFAVDPSISGSCSTSATVAIPVVLNPAPTAFNVTGGGSICPGGGGLPVGLSGSQAGVSYQLIRNGSNVGAPVPGTGSAISFGNQTAGGTYTVQATNSTTGCPAAMTGSVQITLVAPYPIQTVTGGGGFCPNQPGVPVGLGGSTTGVTYTLLCNGAPVGSLPGTGGALNFGLQTQPGDYSVAATDGTCAAPMNDTVTVVAHPAPNTGLVTLAASGTVCIGTQLALFNVFPSETGVRYIVYNSNGQQAPQFPSQMGNGGLISFGTLLTSTTLPLGPNDFSLLAIDTTTGCADTMTRRASFQVASNDTIAFTATVAPVCQGEDAVVTVTYTGPLPRVAFSIIDTVGSSGNPASFHVVVAPTGPYQPTAPNIIIPADSLPQPGTRLLQIVGAELGGQCPARGLINITVVVNPLPDASLALVGDTACAGRGFDITVLNPQPSTDYGVFLNGQPLPSTRTTVGNTALLAVGASPLVQTPGTYTLRVRARNTLTGCQDTLTQTVNVVIQAAPLALPVQGSYAVCEGQSVAPAAQPQAGVTYQWYDDAASATPRFVGDVLPTFTPAANDTLYLEAVNPIGCRSTRRPVIIDVTPLPAAPALRDTLVCVGQAFTLQVAGPTGGLVFRWYDGAAAPTPFAITNGSLVVAGGVLQDTIFYVSAENGACEGPRSPYTVRLVDRSFTSRTDTLRGCLGSVVSLTLPADPGLTYQWYTDTTAAPFDTDNQAAITLLSPSAQPIFVRVQRQSCPIGTHRLTALPYANPDSGFVALPASPAQDSLAELRSPAQPGVSYSWEADGAPIGTGPVLSHIFPQFGDVTVRLTATSAQGCVTVTERVVTVRPPNDDIFVPNAFSPNGDGSNDMFRVYGLQAPQQFQLQIYSRWGIKLYESTDFSAGWDGNANGGSPSPEGVYVFYLKVTTSTGKPLERSGSITLLR